MKRIAKSNFNGLEVGEKYTIKEVPNCHRFFYVIESDIIFLKENLNDYFEPKQKKDKVVTQVLNKFKERSKIGIKKYGTTLHENNTDDFLNHLQEELMDAILYLQKLKNDEK